MGLDHLVDKAATAWRVPDVDADRCVHSQLETATCRACLEACPRDAWVMDDDMLGIDVEACDGCGLCVPVCSEGAVLPDYHPDIRQWRGETLAFASCEYAIDHPVSGRLPCVHGIGLNELMRLRRRGVSRLIVSHGDCDACSRGRVRRLDSLVVDVNQVLSGRSLRNMMWVPLGAADWLSLYAKADDGAQPALSRRNFLRKATATAVEHAAPQVRDDETAELVPPGRGMPEASAGAPAFFVPGIDAVRCNGCDACVRICPHEAIGLTDGQDAYVLDVAACTGCRLCVDVCDQDAVHVESWGSVPSSAIVPLRTRRCTGCGAGFHEPLERLGEGSLCRICDQAGHFRNLFQVMN